MKEKILAAIKAKFPKVNLSKKRLDAIAAKIETKVIDDETKIDAAINDFNDFNPIEEIAKHDDKVRNLEAKIKETEKPADKKDDKKTEPEKVELPEDTPSWVKTMLENQNKLNAEIAQIRGEKVVATIREQLTTKHLKDIPTSYWAKRALPEKADDIETFADEVKADYNTFTQELTDKGLANIPLPGGATGSAKDKQAAVSPEIKAYAEKHIQAPAKTAEPAKV